MGLDSVVKVNITLSSAPISQASFGVPLILGLTNPGWSGGDVVHPYSTPSDMLTDGFTLTDPEYVWASALYSGGVSPNTFLVGKRAGATTAPQDTFTVPAVVVGNVYAFNINGTACSYTAVTSDTDQQVLLALATQATATGAVTSLITNVGSNKLLTLTGVTPGVGVTYTNVSLNLTHISTVAVEGLTQDIAAVRTKNDAWYALLTPEASATDILQGAAVIETLRKIYFPVTNDSTVPTTSTTDVLSKLNAAAYDRTIPIYSIANFTTGIDAAWVGSKLPAAPGQATWDFATLAGQVPETLTDSAVATIIGTPVSETNGKKGNVYYSLGGVNIMSPGQAASGQFVDITIGKDWLQSTIQSNIYAILKQASDLNRKIPFTDTGAAIIASGVQAAIKTGVKTGLVDESQGTTLDITKVADTPESQRAARKCPDISFSCVLAGAVNSVEVQGSVTI